MCLYKLSANEGGTLYFDDKKNKHFYFPPLSDFNLSSFNYDHDNNVSLLMLDSIYKSVASLNFTGISVSVHGEREGGSGRGGGKALRGKGEVN